MKVLQTNQFQKQVERLHENEKKNLDKVIREIIENPNIGKKKKGVLSKLRVHKFKLNRQLMLLGYTFEARKITLTLISIASHENFYRNITR